MVLEGRLGCFSGAAVGAAAVDSVGRLRRSPYTFIRDFY